VNSPHFLCAQGISVASLTNPDKDGYLMKQGGNIKTWKKRWCVLKDGSIFYFKTPKVQTSTAPSLHLADCPALRSW
jgi:hypothetical protein